MESAHAPGRGRAELVRELRALGIRRGEILLVHSTLRSLGPVEGGARALLEALLEVLGPEGTLVVYTACPENSDTSRMAKALTEHLDPQEKSDHQAAMAAYVPDKTPATPLLGWFSEEVRADPRSVRSAHPQTSFTAIGADAGWLTDGHRLHSHLGPHSPVQKLYDRRARALLIGLPIWCCTPVHLAEYWVDEPPLQLYGCVMEDARGRHWRHFQAVELRDGHLEALGDWLDQKLPERTEGTLGEAHCFVLPIRETVDSAFDFLRNGVD